MSDKEILKALSEPIQTKTREGSIDKTTGKPKIFDFIPHQDVTKRLNDVFGLDWNFEIIRETIIGDQAAVVIRLHYPSNNGFRFKDAFAGKKFSGGMELGNCLKSAASLALVKAASLIGIKGFDPEDEIADEQIETIKSLYKKLNKKVPSDSKLNSLTIGDANTIIADLQESAKSL